LRTGSLICVWLFAVLGPLNGLSDCAEDELEGPQTLKAPHAFALHVTKTFFRVVFSIHFAPLNLYLPKYSRRRLNVFFLTFALHKSVLYGLLCAPTHTSHARRRQLCYPSPLPFKLVLKKQTKKKSSLLLC